MKIYRIYIDNNKKKYSYYDILKIIIHLGDYCYSDKSFFISSNKSFSEISEEIYKFGTVEEINCMKDISQCTELVRQWCSKKIYNEVIENFENSDSGQKKMKEIMSYLEKIEKYKKGGVENGNRKYTKE